MVDQHLHLFKLAIGDAVRIGNVRVRIVGVRRGRIKLAVETLPGEIEVVPKPPRAVADVPQS